MAPENGLVEGEDGELRCFWGMSAPDYVAYHDEEWGRPVSDDRRLLEKLCLEGFQSGLSWLTILRKRDRFREVFEGFDPERVAAFGETDVQRLLGDAGIVRHRGKIEATLANARAACSLIERHGSLASWVWRYEPTAEERPETVDWPTLRTLSQTASSKRLSKALKAEGFRFVGPTTVYAFMQAMGLVNDHIEGCCVRARVEELRGDFVRP
ncbi:MAG: DNA-3-methyladenine glycosylase I [Alphaproteobacteria bacterium]|nr:DNA-3-methyladenine glycosylase I [Alphaproteobacteria bacterium]